MLITASAISALEVGFSQIYRSAWDSTPEWSSQVATTVPSSTKSNTYGWMARIASVRQWLGPRVIQNLSTHSYSLENEPYELTVGVDRDDIEDDNLGVYNPLMAELGRAARKWADQQLKTVLQAGTTGLGFDGVAFFATTHDLDPAGNQSNNFTTTALSAANYQSTREAMMAYTGEDGEPLGVMPDLLIVPPQLEGEARTILNAEFVVDSSTGGNTNIWRNSARLLVVPELSNQATTWYLADTSRAIKPLVWQLRRAMQLVSKTNLNDDAVFYQKQFVWGIDGRGAAGYGPWFLMARAIA